MLAEAIQFKIPAQRSKLKPIRDEIYDLLKSSCVDEESRSLCVLAVDEIVSNKIIHAYKENEREEIRLTVQVSSSEITFTIEDDGIPFDHNNYSIPSIDVLIEGKVKGSLGMLIVHKTMDSVEFISRDGINTCILTRIRN